MSKTKIDAFPKMCPACGQSFGTSPDLRCQHCATSLKSRIAMRTLIIVTIILFASSFAIFGYASTETEYGVNSIKDLYEWDDAKSFSPIRVKGWVTNVPRYSEYGSLTFYVQDESGGTIKVNAYESEADELIKNRNVPGVGDLVDIEGSFGVGPTITIDRFEDFEILEQPDFEFMSISELIDFSDQMGDAYMEGFPVTTVGAVSGVREFWWAISYTITDGTNDVLLFIPKDLAQLTYPFELPSLSQYDLVVFSGTIDIYYGTIEVIPRQLSDIEVL